MWKNTAGQRVSLVAIDVLSGAPKIGDTANITFYVCKDDGAVVPLAAAVSEKNSTTAKGVYDAVLTQAETNADKLVFTGTSTTASVSVIPLTVYTRIPSAPVGAADQVTIRVFKDYPTNSVVLADASVWITSDAAGLLVVEGPKQTDTLGKAKFLLNAGNTYYLWCQKDGINSIQGRLFTAVADA